MDFVHLLMHGLTEIPTNTASMPITYYLPKNTTMDSSLAAYLFFDIRFMSGYYSPKTVAFNISGQ